MDETSTAERSMRRKRPVFQPESAQDWDAYYETIKRLYVTENLQLETVKMIMEEVYGFKATYEHTWWKILLTCTCSRLQILADDCTEIASTRRTFQNQALGRTSRALK
jgi:hypothetical protein